MEETIFLEKFNKSDFGKYLRAKFLKISQEEIDRINEIYNYNITFYTLENYKGILEFNVPSNVYKEIIEANEYKFSNISEIRTILLNQKINYNSLTKENINSLKEVLDVCKVNSLKIMNIDDEIVDLSQLPINSLELYGGFLSEENIKKFPNVSKLGINSVGFNEIGDLLYLENLTDLSIIVSELDTQLDMSQIDKFIGLKSFKISGQILNQRELNKICKLKNLKELEIGYGRANEEHNIKDYSKLLEMTNIEKINNFDNCALFCRKPIINNINEFKQLLKCKFFQINNEKEVIYIGREPLPVDLLDEIGSINLEILSPFVVSKEFAEKYEKEFPGRIRIISDLYQEYTIQEIYFIAQKMREIIESIPKNASDFEKVAYICKVIAERCFYDNSGRTTSSEYMESRKTITRSLKGGLLENKLVCEGYAFLLKKLLDELGIDCKMISGFSLSKNNEEKGKHAWNQVKIDGVWYNLDLTWDVRRIRAGEELRNFLLDDKEFYKSHKACETRFDINNSIHDGKFDFNSYKNKYKKIVKVEKCSKSYDKQKIEDFFVNNSAYVKSSSEIVSDILCSEEVTIDKIKSNMNYIVNAENGNDIMVEEEKLEGRNG